MKPERRLISSWSAPGRGATFKGALQQNFNRTLNVFAHTTALAVESNTITLDPDVKDAWGLPALRVTYKNHPDDLRTMAFFRDPPWTCSRLPAPSRSGDFPWPR